MCPLSHSNLLLWLVIKYYHISTVRKVMSNVSNAGKPLSPILDNKNLHSSYFVLGTFLSNLHRLTHLILLATLL